MRLPLVDRGAEMLRRLYAQAEAQLQALVAEAVGSGALGTARYRQTRLAEVQRILADLNGEAIPEATQLVVDSYQLGGQIAGVTGAFGTSIDQEAVELLADNLTGNLQDATERVGRQVDDTFRREALRQAAVSLIEGGTRRDATKRLQQALIDQGIRSFQDRAGREWSLADYTTMAIRTTTREAVTSGTRNRMLAVGADLVEIALADTACPQCVAAYKDKTFSLTGATDGYSVLERPPPLHPRDRCVMTPAAANLDALERELGLVAA